MSSDADASHRADIFKQESLLMEKKDNRISIIVGALLVFNLLFIGLILSPFYFLFLTTAFPPLIFLAPMVLPVGIYHLFYGYFPSFLILAILNGVTLFYANKRISQGIAKQLIQLVFAISVACLFISVMTLKKTVEGIPIFISRETATRQIHDCNVDLLTRDSNGIHIKFEGGEDATKNYIVMNWDFDVLLKAARTVQESCGYEFEGFKRGIEGFKKEHHLGYITLKEAAQLLNSCTVDTVIYGDPASGWKRTTGMSSGVQVWSKEKPWQIWVQGDLKAETFPIFQKAKKKCPNLEIIGL
jgi:hypothetical protein